MKTAFISGHGNLTFEEFITQYKPLIDDAIESNHSFVVGDFRGCDILAQEYLKNKTSKVTVYHCFDKPRYKVDFVDLLSKKWKYKKGFQSDLERDTAMTINSDYDIAWVKIGKENSGTANNIKRRTT